MKWIVKPADATVSSPAGMGIEFQYRSDGERRATEGVVEQLMAAIEGLRGDSFATGLGVRGLLSANLIERGLVKQTKREGRVGLGIESTWEKYFAQHGGQNDQ